ncbi:chemotaxis protein CheW [Tautonia sociabilis]|uniref:Chemotaxis protein CheW n=1 Tax=Tautonia sociabilis TaxID=2080755 RepID=A0A432MJD9_9BACT|nr:chemotaxis protein CheW [Tautonia sociabilis]RUL87503.1 chemotaxis protein [Tautonia sociabilis]
MSARDPHPPADSGDDGRLAEQARLLFDRPAPEGYLDDWVEVLSRPDREAGGESRPLLIFRVGPEWLALSTSSLVVVAEPRPVHRVPHRSGGLLRGIVDIRGRLIPCVELGSLLSIDPSAGPGDGEGRARIVVVESVRGAGWIAFEADEVAGVHLIDDDLMRGIPATLERTGPHCRATFRWRDRTVGVLDDRRVLLELERLDQ